jgi:hypothetical protein
MSNEKKPDTALTIPPASALETDDAVTGEVVDPPVFEQNEEVILLFFNSMSDTPMVTRDLGTIIEDLRIRLPRIDELPIVDFQADNRSELLRNFLATKLDYEEKIPLFPNWDLERPGSCQFCNADLKTEFPSRLCPTHGAVDCEGCLRPFTRDENRAVCTHCNKVRPEPIEPSKADQAITAEKQPEPGYHVPKLDFQDGKIRLTSFTLEANPWDNRFRFIGFTKKDK